jgi:hypothetical protein
VPQLIDLCCENTQITPPKYHNTTMPSHHKIIAQLHHLVPLLMEMYGKGEHAITSTHYLYAIATL